MVAYVGLWEDDDQELKASILFMLSLFTSSYNYGKFKNLIFAKIV